jgi:hypothetical protein
MKSIVVKTIKVCFLKQKNKERGDQFIVLAIRPSRIDCPDTQLFLTVVLDDIDPDDISLGDGNCKPIWANDTHAKFISHIDNCSLVGFLSIPERSKKLDYDRFRS